MTKQNSRNVNNSDWNKLRERCKRASQFIKETRESMSQEIVVVDFTSGTIKDRIKLTQDGELTKAVA